PAPPVRIPSGAPAHSRIGAAPTGHSAAASVPPYCSAKAAMPGAVACLFAKASVTSREAEAETSQRLHGVDADGGKSRANATHVAVDRAIADHAVRRIRPIDHLIPRKHLSWACQQSAQHTKLDRAQNHLFAVPGHPQSFEVEREPAM